jgi:hypothetical protein
MIEKNWLDLKKPDELEIKQSEYNPSQAVIEVGPFERGFGMTCVACAEPLSGTGPDGHRFA